MVNALFVQLYSMKKIGWGVLLALAGVCTLQAQPSCPRSAAEDSTHIMDQKYWDFWNSDVQAKIDQNIEQYRKKDGRVKVDPNVEVRVEQLSHSFIFGGNIFLFGQLANAQQNREYEQTFGTLFNAATIPFYWKTLEPQPGHPRYEAGSEPIFRRPPTDPIVDFCEEHQILAKGHAMIYGLRLYGHPDWMPEDRQQMEQYFEDHIRELAKRYKGRVQMWDVVNESVDQVNRGLMPDDYTYKCFRWAMKYLPRTVELNSNDVDLHDSVPNINHYVEIVRDLVDRGIRIDHVGAQMHIFNPKESRQIADGDSILYPEHLQEVMDCLRGTDRPLHISELTISAPDSTPEGSMIQAILARNLYRFWFSDPDVTAITWWNVVDGGGAPGEPSYSGLYDQQMNRKPAYGVLDELINKEWKTDLTVQSDAEGWVNFRGFTGKYRISWTDKKGKQHTKEYVL